MLKNFLKKTFVYDFIIRFRQYKSKEIIKRAFREYKYSYSPVHDDIIKYSHELSIPVFIETGTYVGNTLFAVKNNFKKLYSIELNSFIHELATKKFINETNITLLHGESSEVLKNLLPNIESRAIFWLDAHYSSGATSKGKKHTPIFEELDAIFSHRIKDHIILIDDMKDFIGIDDYPTIEELRGYVLNNSGYSFEIHDGVAHLISKV